MNKISLILVLFIFCLTTKIFSQKCRLPYENGDLIINDSKKGIVCFLREPDQNVVGNIFHTKYTFKINGEKETYLDFNFYKDQNIIEIIYTDATGSKTPKSIKFDPAGSIWMFKDYKANDTLINKYDSDTILFTIIDPSKPYITLNHFQLMDNDEVLFKLQDINDDKLLLHTLAAKLYYARIKPQPIPVDETAIKQHQKNIEEIFNEMRDYTDSVIKKIKSDSSDIIKNGKNGQILEATSEVSQKFKIQLDSIFIPYYKNIFHFEDSTCDFEIKCFCDGEGKIKSCYIHSVESTPIKWFEDSFNFILKPRIEEGIYKTMTTSLNNPNLTNEFTNRYRTKFDNLDPTNDEKNSFDKLQVSILRKLENYSVLEINCPTNYTYDINYRSTVKEDIWIYEKDKKGNTTVRIDGAVDQPAPDLIIYFKENIGRPKKGKYNINTNEISINNKLIGAHLQEIK